MLHFHDLIYADVPSQSCSHEFTISGYVRSKVKGEAEVSHMAACGQVNKERCIMKANVWNEYYTTQLLITVQLMIIILSMFSS